MTAKEIEQVKRAIRYALDSKTKMMDRENDVEKIFKTFCAKKIVKEPADPMFKPFIEAWTNQHGNSFFRGAIDGQVIKKIVTAFRNEPNWKSYDEVTLVKMWTAVVQFAAKHSFYKGKTLTVIHSHLPTIIYEIKGRIANSTADQFAGVRDIINRS